MVQSGALGEVRFCRAFQAATTDGGVHLMDIIQFAFDEATPVSITAQGSTPGTMLATFRYPGFVASYESRAGNAYGTAFYGTKATLVVNRVADTHVAHWKNFLACIRTRAKPISEIETCVRSTATCVLANIAMRQGMTLDWRSNNYEMVPFMCRSAGWVDAGERAKPYREVGREVLDG
jgi:predicted dehydrogenase